MNNKRLRNSGIINSKSLINDNKQKQIKKKQNKYNESTKNDD